MIFQHPLIPIAFEKLFSDNSIVIHFLNSILNHQDDEKITKIITNTLYPINAPLHDGKNFIDLLCINKTGKKYVVLMQPYIHTNFIETIQLHSSIGLYRQLETENNYKKSYPVIFVAILNFSILENPNPVSHHTIRDEVTNKTELNHLKFCFIELRKFTKTIDQLIGTKDQWLFFLKHAEDLRKVPTEFENIPVMQTAFDILEQGNWTDKELARYESIVKQLRNEASERETAQDLINEAAKKTKEYEILKAMVEAEKSEIETEKTIIQEQKTALEKQYKTFVTSLLTQNIMNIEDIAKLTGLTVAEIQLIKSKK